MWNVEEDQLCVCYLSHVDEEVGSEPHARRHRFCVEFHMRTLVILFAS